MMTDFAKRVADDRLSRKKKEEAKQKHQQLMSMVGELLNTSLTNAATAQKEHAKTRDNVKSVASKSDLSKLYQLLQELNLTMFTMFMAQYESLERIIESMYSNNKDD